MDFFGRLREERARLGLTQQEVADTANVHVKTVRRWESQVAIPLDAMIPLLAIGYDVQYVASGVRSKNISEVREKGVEYAVAPGYSRDEVDLLRSYRALTPGQREQARAMLGVLALKVHAVVREPRAAAAGAGKTRSAQAAELMPAPPAGQGRTKSRTRRGA